MSFFSRNTNKYRRVVIDIASGSVGGAIILFEKGVKPKIEYSNRINLPIRTHVEEKSLIEDTEKAIENVSNDVHKFCVDKIKEKINQIDIVCASPWFSARTRSVVYEKPEQFVVTEKLIREISVKESEIMKKELEASMISIEERIAHIRLNGYECQNPLQKKVNRIELLLFASFIPKDFADNVINITEKALSAKKVAFHSLPFVSFHALSRVWHNDKQFAFLNVGRELSEFLLVDNGAIAETLSFPVGTNHLVRAIATKQDIAKELAESSLSVFARGFADGHGEKKVEAAIEPLKEEWLVYVDQVIRESLPEHWSVQKLYLSADMETLSFWSQSISSHVRSVAPLEAETLESFITHPANVRPDLFISIASLYLDTLNLSTS